MTHQRPDPLPTVPCPRCFEPLAVILHGLFNGEGAAHAVRVYGDAVEFGGCEFLGPTHVCRRCWEGFYWDGEQVRPAPEGRDHMLAAGRCPVCRGRMGWIIYRESLDHPAGAVVFPDTKPLVYGGPDPDRRYSRAGIIWHCTRCEQTYRLDWNAWERGEGEHRVLIAVESPWKTPPGASATPPGKDAIPETEWERLCQMAQMAEREGRLDEAEGLSLEAIRRAEEAFGPDHPEVTRAYWWLYALYQSRWFHERYGQDGLALPPDRVARLRELLAHREAQLGPDHPGLLPLLLLLLRDLPSGERARVLRIAESTYGADHPVTRACLGRVARLNQNAWYSDGYWYPSSPEWFLENLRDPVRELRELLKAAEKQSVFRP